MSTKFVVAVAIIVSDGPRVLALRRAPHKPGPGLWEVVSGRIELHEDPINAALREVHEETGLEVVLDRRPLTSYAAKRGDAPMIVLVYGARVSGGSFARSDEHDAHAWLTPNEFRARSTLTRLCDAVDAYFRL